MACGGIQFWVGPVVSVRLHRILSMPYEPPKVRQCVGCETYGCSKENGADVPEGERRRSRILDGPYFAAAYNASTLFQSITFHTALR